MVSVAIMILLHFGDHKRHGLLSRIDPPSPWDSREGWCSVPILLSPHYRYGIKQWFMSTTPFSLL